MAARRADPYLYRWTLAVLGRGRRCYLHRYLGSDWARDLHDHPKVFWSIGLWGGYVEQTPAGMGRPLVVVMAVEEYERLKVFETGHVDSRPSTTGKAERWIKPSTTRSSPSSAASRQPRRAFAFNTGQSDAFSRRQKE